MTAQARQAPAAARPSRGRRVVFILVAAVFLVLPAALLTAEGLMRLLNVEPLRFRSLPKWYAFHDGQFQDMGEWGDQLQEGRYLIRRPSPYGVKWGEYVPRARMQLVYGSNPRGYFEPDNRLTMEVNSLGLRGPEVELEKPAGTVRILGLGDSITFGDGVREEHTFLRRLEGLLAKDRAGGRRCEVINAGIGAYDTRDEVIYLENRWLQLKPDVVLVVLYLNDVYPDRAIASWGENFALYVDKPPGLAQYSYLWDFLQHQRTVRLYNRRMLNLYLTHHFLNPKPFLENPASQAEGVTWLTARAALTRAAELSRERGFKLGLVIFPVLYRLDGQHPFDEFYQFVENSAREMGIPALRLIDAFRGRDASGLWVHPTDHHPNEDAHGIAAEALEPFVRSLITDERR